MLNILLVIYSLLLPPSDFKNGKEIVNAMHTKYHKTWYKNFTFIQNTTFYQNDKVVREQKWYEALSSPGNLHIKFDSFTSGSGMLFTNGEQHVYRNNRIVNTKKKLHALLLTAFDAFIQPVENTISGLKNLKFDLSKIRTGKKDGREYYVIGTNKIDLSANQFWVDKEFLYVTRVITKDASQGFIMDVLFNKYERISGGWVAPEVLIYINGELYMKEEYTNMATPKELDKSIFKKENISKAKW